jgi:hypothetical protein
MCREDLRLNEINYSQIFKWAEIWQPVLATTIKDSITINNNEILLSKNKIPESLACDFLCDLMDAEINSDTTEDLKYFGRLVELWRQIAEGPL